MAWEKRGNRTYYYRVQRVDGKTVRTYFGSGEAAHEASREDQARKDRAQARREDRRFSQIINEHVRNLGEFTMTISNIQLRSEGLHMSRGGVRKFNRRTILPTIPETVAKLEAIRAKQSALAAEAQALYEAFLDRIFPQSALCAANEKTAKQEFLNSKPIAEQRANFEQWMDYLFPTGWPNVRRKAPCATNEKPAKQGFVAEESQSGFFPASGLQAPRLGCATSAIPAKPTFAPLPGSPSSRPPRPGTPCWPEIPLAPINLSSSNPIILKTSWVRAQQAQCSCVI